MRKKRWLALALVLCLFAGSFSGVSAQEDSTDTLYEMESEFLKSAGILKSIVQADANVTRADFVRLVIEVLYPDADFSETVEERPDLFNDVKSSDESYEYIRAAKELGIITGDSNHFFYPDRTVTYVEAIAIVVNALCYTAYAGVKGGYPTGYYSIAEEIQLLRELSLSFDRQVNGDVAVKLLYNALFADMVVVSSVSPHGPAFEIDHSSNLMRERYHITRYQAVVMDDGFTAIGDQSLCDSERVVLSLKSDGSKLTVYRQDTDIDRQLGSMVYAFVRDNPETGRRELVHYTPHPDNGELWLSSSRIMEKQNNFIGYERDRNDSKMLKASFSNPVVFVNGVHTAEPFETLDLKNSMIRLVDPDGNRDYDTILIYRFDMSYGNGESIPRNIVVDRVASTQGEEYIGCRLNPSISLDCKDKECELRFISGNAKRLEDIPKGAVVSVAESSQPLDGKTVYFLAVSEQSVEGNLQSIGANGDEMEIDGTLYTVSDSFLAVKGETWLSRLPFDERVVCAVDVMGNISFVEGSAKDAKQYAYLIGAESDELSDTVRVKLFDPQMLGVVTMPLCAKVTIDGKPCRGAQEQIERLAERPAQLKPISGGPDGAAYLSRPVIWKYNINNEITMLDTDTPNSQNNPAYQTADDGQINLNYAQSPIVYSTTELEDPDALKAGLRTLRTQEYYKRINSMGGRFYITSDTVIIRVPDIDTIGLNEMRKNDSVFKTDTTPFVYENIKAHEGSMEKSQYQRLTVADIEDKPYDMQAYDVDQDTGVASLIVLRGVDSLLDGEWENTISPMAVFLRTAQIYNEAAQGLLTRVYYTVDGQTEQYADFDFEKLLYYYKVLVYGSEAGNSPVIPALKKGDIIRVEKENGRGTHIERVANLDGIKQQSSMFWYSSASKMPYTSAKAHRSTYPFYISQYKTTLDGTYAVCLGQPYRLRGTDFSVVMPTDSLESFRLEDPQSYVDQYFKLSSTAMTVITFQPDGDVRVKRGNVNDIITYEGNGNSFEGASILLFFQRNGEVSQTLVINDLR